MKNKKKITLCRLGGINKLIKQKGNYDATAEYDSMHNAPERRGFYAFVHPYIEKRILTASFKNKHYKNKEFNKDTYKIFDFVGGSIWTHFEPKNKSDILEKKGFYWYKVKLSVFISTLNDEYVEQQKFAHGNIKIIDGDHIGKIKNPYLGYDKSDLEVFICSDSIIA